MEGANTAAIRASAADERKEVTYTLLVWLFLFGSVMGTLIEGLWCILKGSGWETHASTVWGPFCIIYGFGAVGVYLLSVWLKGKGSAIQFVLFSLSGAFVEYFGSLFQEKVFGSTSWDYSHHFLNIDGRVSLRMTLIWGALGIMFVRVAFPALTKLLSKLRAKPWRLVCVVLSVFMAVDLLVSGAAVLRWHDRLEGNTKADNAVERALDEAFDNDTMSRQYPNMVFTDPRHTSGDE